MLLIGLGILLLVSFLGSRLQGISLSMLGGLGVFVLTFFFGDIPVDPPFHVILCIATIVTAIGAIEASGGLSYLIQIAESLIRKHPHRIIYISPIVTYCITFLCGTNHIAYSILPIVAEVSRKVGIRPERPLSLAVIAALHGALASPISSIMVIISGLLRPFNVAFLNIVIILIPSTIVGLLLTTFIVSQLNNRHTVPFEPEIEAEGHVVDNQQTATLHNPLFMPKRLRRAKLSVMLFLLGSLSIVCISSIKSLRPSWEVDGTRLWLSDDMLLPLIMLSTAALITLCFRIPPHVITQGKAFTAGVQGMFSLLGIAWLSSTFIENNRSILLHYMATYFTSPWQFAIILFLIAAIMGSTAATIKTVLPLGIALGIPAKILLASMAAANGVFMIPIYPTIVAAINLDVTGSTRIGKFLFNHSFMLPGLLSVMFTIAVAFLLITGLWQ